MPPWSAMVLGFRFKCVRDVCASHITQACAGGGLHTDTASKPADGSPELNAGLYAKSNYHSPVVTYFRDSVTRSAFEAVKLTLQIYFLTFTF